MANTNETSTQDLVLRCQWEAYMDVGNEYALIGEGFTNFPESKNPKEYSRKYINYKTEKTDVIGYAPSIAYSCDAITNDPVVTVLIDVHENELLGNDTHCDIVSVNCWKETETKGEYEATKRTYAIIPDSKGDGTDALVYTGTLKAVSDIVKGSFNRQTKTFTAGA